MCGIVDVVPESWDGVGGVVGCSASSICLGGGASTSIGSSIAERSGGVIGSSLRPGVPGADVIRFG